MIQLDYPWGFTELVHTLFFYQIFHSSYHSPCITLMQGVNVFYNLVFEQKQKVSAIDQCVLNEQYSLILLGQHETVCFYSFIYMLFISRSFTTQACSRRQWCHCVENRGKGLLGLVNLKNHLCLNCGWERAFTSFSLSRRHRV